MTLKSYFKVSGFNSRKKELHLELAPITILVGANGSGKSSAISALRKIQSLASHTDYVNESNIFKVLEFNILESQIFGLTKNSSLTYKLPIKLSNFHNEYELILHYNQYNADKIIITGMTIQNTKSRKPLMELKYKLTDKKSKSGAINIFFDIINIAEEYNNEIERLKFLKEYPMRMRWELKTDPDDEDVEDVVKGEKQIIEMYLNKIFSEFDKISEKITLRPNNHMEESPLGGKGTSLTIHPKFENINMKDELFISYKYENEIENAELENYKNIINTKFVREGYNFEDCSELVLQNIINNIFKHNSDSILFNFHMDKIGRLFLDETDSIAFNIILEKTGTEIVFSEIYKHLIGEYLLKDITANVSSFFRRNNNTIYFPPNRFQKDNLETNPIAFAVNKAKVYSEMGYNSDAFSFFANYWFKQFGIRGQVDGVEDAVDFLTNSNRIDKEGYGLRQIAPLIVALSTAQIPKKPEDYDPNDIQSIFNFSANIQNFCTENYLIEEPEANLHPALQSKLADLFLDAYYKFGHRFVIETHSEYIIRKLQAHVGKGKVDPNLIKIYYFEMDETVREIKINSDGSLSDSFGPGFIDEAQNLALELFFGRLN
jgi:predicted ATPase